MNEQAGYRNGYRNGYRCDPPKSLETKVVTDGDRFSGDHGHGQAVNTEAAEMLDCMRDIFKRYLYLPSGATELLAAYALATHSYMHADIFPRLYITSPVENCGKSTTRDILTEMCFKSMSEGDASVAALYRWIDKHGGTILLDEVDNWLDEDFIALLNNGYRKRNSGRLRCDGDKNEPRRFKTFGPMVLAGIGELGGNNAKSFRPTKTRCLTVQLNRRPPDVEQPYLAWGDLDPELKKLNKAATKWSADKKEPLTDPRPQMPPALIDSRDRDNWRHIFAVCDLVGGHWPQTIRKVAIGMVGGKNPEEDDLAFTLAAMLYCIRDAEKIKTADLIDRLRKLDDDRLRTVSDKTLPRLLRKYNAGASKADQIKSKPLRFGADRKQDKGYEVAPIKAAAHSYFLDLDHIRAIDPDSLAVAVDQIDAATFSGEYTGKPLDQLSDSQIEDILRANGAAQ